ncbi:MarR family winged helix-turn-helix transcriptional regulator [Microbacterium sp. NPDC089695]|uniref:MarR family winged helix-turn-helix transcriptional regulator n=1 Tax=Microbacterium sp. NPDC089695 TaxID=3364198 RepID=UPI0037FA5850
MPGSTSDGLSPDELEIWASVASLLERLPAALDAQLQRDSGLTHFEQGILQALDLAPNRTLRLSVIAAYASCTLSRLSRAITRLEGKGWVRREVDPDDGRYTRGRLTSAGHEKVAASTPGHQALVRELVFDTLTAAQARQLGALARRVATAVGPGEPWSPPRP